MGAAWGSEGVRRTDYRIERLRGTVHRRPVADPGPLQCSDGAEEDRQEDISIGGKKWCLHSGMLVVTSDTKHHRDS